MLGYIMHYLWVSIHALVSEICHNGIEVQSQSKLKAELTVIVADVEPNAMAPSGHNCA